MEEHQKPIIKVLQKHFDILNPTLSGMEGYESRNYKIECADACYVLKMYDA